MSPWCPLNSRQTHQSWKLAHNPESLRSQRQICQRGQTHWITTNLLPFHEATFARQHVARLASQNGN